MDNSVFKFGQTLTPKPKLKRPKRLLRPIGVKRLKRPNRLETNNTQKSKKTQKTQNV